MRAFNLFRRKGEADLYCAVPQDKAVPDFLTDDLWEHAQSIELRDLSGFDAKAAEIAAEATGYYLFHASD